LKSRRKLKGGGIGVGSIRKIRKPVLRIRHCGLSSQSLQQEMHAKKDNDRTIETDRSSEKHRERSKNNAQGKQKIRLSDEKWEQRTMDQFEGLKNRDTRQDDRLLSKNKGLRGL